MKFDPAKYGATEVFDPLQYGATAVVDTNFNQVESEDMAAGIWDNSIESGLSIDTIKELYTTPKRDGLIERGAKNLANKLILSDIEQGRPSTAIAHEIFGLGAALEAAEKVKSPSEFNKLSTWGKIKALPNMMLAARKGYYAPEASEISEFADQALRDYRGAVDFDIVPPEKLSEKVVDVGTGIGAFITRVTLTKKILPAQLNKYPNLMRALSFEMANTDGKPGEGAAMAAVIGLPGSLPGITTAQKAFRLSIQSGSLAGYTKLKGGSNEDVVIAAFIPVTFAAIGVAKGTISDYKMVKTWQGKLPFTRDVPLNQSMKMAKSMRAMYEIRGRESFRESVRLSAKSRLTPEESVRLGKLQVQNDKILNLWDKVHGKNYTEFNKLAVNAWEAHGPAPIQQITGEVTKGAPAATTKPTTAPKPTQAKPDGKVGGGLTAEQAISERQQGEWDRYLLTNDRVKGDGYGVGTEFETKEPKGDNVKVYRAVPLGQEKINAGDFVTASKAYAQDHLNRHISGELTENPELAEGGHIISAEISKSDLGVSGANELIYIPAPEGIKVPPKPTQAKPETIPTLEQVAETQRIKVKTLTDKAITELGKAERPREIIEALKTKELGKRAARSAQAAEVAEGEGRLSAALGQLKGPLTEYKNPDFTPLKDTMSKPDIDALHDDIWVRPHNPDHFARLNTAKAWSKVVEGFVPTRGEILLLEKQWGKEFAKGLLRKRPFGDKAWDTAADISNFMRTMLAGGDMSVAGRQLRVLGQRYPVEFGKAIKEGAKAYVSEDLSKIVRQGYESSEYHKEAKKYLQFFDPAGTETTPPAERPEWYVSHYPEKVPILGHLIRMGNRNYVETMNSFTQSIWDKLRAQDIANGTEPTKADLNLRGKWLMSMSGRPEIGGVVGRRIAPIASGFFFAPRFAVSRFTSPLYLRHLASGDPVAREVGRNTAIGFASFIGTNIAILSLLKLSMGDKVSVELDPRSPDWGKARIGNLRIDLWAGYQQAARFLVQMVLGQYKTQAGKIKEVERLETIGRFVRGKENPLVSLISDLYKGRTYEGDRPFSPPKGEIGKILDTLQVPKLIQGVGKEAYRRMLFMWVQDFVEASANDGWPLGFTSGALSFFGNNTSSYEDTAFTKVAKFKDNIAQTEHGMNWNELNSNQQKRLSRINKQTFFDLELQANIEGARRDDYDYVGRLIEDEKKAGKKVYKKLKPENRKLLDGAGISLGLSRKIGDWEIDDVRYEQYQKLTAEILDGKLSRISNISGWEDIPVNRRIAKIELAVQISKDNAKSKVRREAKKVID